MSVRATPVDWGAVVFRRGSQGAGKDELRGVQALNDRDAASIQGI